MKYTEKNFIVAAVFAAVFASCTIETSRNGKLDGFWHLVRIDTLDTGKSRDLSRQRIFWGVQYKLINVKDADRNEQGYYLRFERVKDSLFVHTPYANHLHQDQGADGGDIPIDDAKLLAPFGINRLEEHFKTEALDGSKMILKSSRLRLYFDSF